MQTFLDSWRELTIEKYLLRQNREQICGRDLISACVCEKYQVQEASSGPDSNKRANSRVCVILPYSRAREILINYFWPSRIHLADFLASSLSLQAEKAGKRPDKMRNLCQNGHFYPNRQRIPTSYGQALRCLDGRETSISLGRHGAIYMRVQGL